MNYDRVRLTSKGRICLSSGKLFFGTKQRARKNLVSLCRKSGESRSVFRVYRCYDCGGYHFGHRPGTKRKRVEKSQSFSKSAVVSELTMLLVVSSCFIDGFVAGLTIPFR